MHGICQRLTAGCLPCLVRVGAGRQRDYSLVRLMPKFNPILKGLSAA